MSTEIVRGDQLNGMEAFVFSGSLIGAQPVSLSAYGVRRLPTDPIGTVVLTLTNVVVGSRIHITPQNDSANNLYDSVAVASTVPVTLNVYSPGNALNDLRVRVRQGTSAPKYQPFETLVTLTASPQSIYIAQVPDLIA